VVCLQVIRESFCPLIVYLGTLDTEFNDEPERSDDVCEFHCRHRRGQLGTRLHFRQEGQKVLGRYSGGSVKRGLLVGEVEGEELRFRYTQVETSGEIHGGRSRCDVQRLPDGRTRILEHFTWRTRPGSGTNVFDEIRPATTP
jgi:hypothetical protein